MNLVTALRGSVIALLMLAGAVPAHADERIGVIAAQLEPAPAGVGGAVLNATFEFEMPQALDEAVQKGIAIYFNIEFELYRKRWYWLDRKLSSSTLTYRLSYSPLTRQLSSIRYSSSGTRNRRRSGIGPDDGTTAPTIIQLDASQPLANDQRPLTRMPSRTRSALPVGANDAASSVSGSSPQTSCWACSS